MSLGAASIASSVIGAGASLLAGNSQASAARDAAGIYGAASQAAVDEQRRQYDLTRADFAPWRETGVAALDRLSSIFLGTPSAGSEPTTRTYTDTVPGADNSAQIGMLQQQLANIPQIHTVWVNGAPQQQLNEQYQRIQSQIANLQAASQPQTTTRTENVPGTGAATPDYSAFYKSPGYQFRLDQGIQALDRSAAARGGLRGGGYGQELTRYAQDYASGEFNNYANRLASLAGAGQTATASTAAAGANSANGISNALLAGAQGQAGAVMNAGTAQASGYAGIANAVNSGLNNYSFLNYLRAGGTPIAPAP